MADATFWTWFGTVGQWVAGVGTCVAAVATLATLSYLIFKDFFKRPALILSFDSDKDVKSQIATVGLEPPERLSRWLRIRVQNKVGRRVAKSCRGFLIGVDSTGADGKTIDHFPNDTRQLNWTHVPPEGQSLDLLPGVVHQLDIAGTIQGMQGLQFMTKPPYALQQPGKYRLTIQVSAEDTEPQIIKLQIEWNGAWESLTGIAIT